MRINLNELNESQKEAVTFKDGVVMITSVAGSGKTRVLTNRTAYLINHYGVDPSNILLTTFSKKAAEEIKERMSSLINKSLLNKITIGTFHSIGYRILRHEYKVLNNPLSEAFDYPQSKILGGKPQQWFIEEIMKEVGLNPQDKNELNANEIIHTISLAKNSLIDENRFYTDCVDRDDFKIAEIYKLYEEKKREQLIIDFDDMLILLYKLFKEYPNILEKYQNKFKYIMVDEAQDNNLSQYELINMLSKKHKNIFIVGDDDQNLYSFRGARPEEFINFNKKYPDVKIISLDINYRSVPHILEVSNNLISHNKNRISKKLVPFKEKTTKNDEVKYNVFKDEEEEAENIALEIEKIKNKGANYKECAILFRTNAQSRAIEDYLIRNMIPYVIYGGVSFYERKEVKDILAYMRLALNPHDNEAFERVVNTPTRYLGKAFINKLKQNSQKRKCSLYDSLKTVQLTPMQHKNAMDYFNLINKLNSIPHNSPSELIREIRKLTNYDNFLKKEAKEEDNDILENLITLQSAALKYNSTQEFIDFIKLVTMNKKQNADAVQVMTIHKSKGLEFPYVFVAGYSENLLPHKFAVDSESQVFIEEERRLAYVANTRAEKELRISSILSYNHRPLIESRFVKECGLIKEETKIEETKIEEETQEKEG